MISLIGFSSLSPKLSGQGPYEVNDSHFSTPYEISGQCSSDIKNLQVKLEGQDWNTLTTLLSNSDGDCSDENFKISFKLEELGFALNDYKTKSIWLRAVSITGESQPQQIDVKYTNTSPPPTTPQATVPTISSINYISNTEIDIKWALPADHGNDEVVISIQNGNVSPDCSSGFEEPAQQTATTNILSGNGTTTFDLNSNDITISICGKNSEDQSNPASMVYYKTPGPIINDSPKMTNEQIRIQGIQSDGASFFNIQYSIDPMPAVCDGSPTILPGEEFIQNSLTPDTMYYLRICAYNNNPTPEKNEVIIGAFYTMKNAPGEPAGLTLTQSASSEKKLRLLGLNTNLKYNIDFAPVGQTLTSDYLSAAIKD